MIQENCVEEEGFKLHKFTSKCKEIIEVVLSEERVEGNKEIDLDVEACNVFRRCRE